MAVPVEYQASYQMSRCRCAPVEGPELPTRAIFSPAFTFCPTLTYLVAVHMW